MTIPQNVILSIRAALSSALGAAVSVMDSLRSIAPKGKLTRKAFSDWTAEVKLAVLPELPKLADDASEGDKGKHKLAAHERQRKLAVLSVQLSRLARELKVPKARSGRKAKEQSLTFPEYDKQDKADYVRSVFAIACKLAGIDRAAALMAINDKASK